MMSLLLHTMIIIMLMLLLNSEIKRILLILKNILSLLFRVKEAGRIREANTEIKVTINVIKTIIIIKMTKITEDVKMYFSYYCHFYFFYSVSSVLLINKNFYVSIS